MRKTLLPLFSCFFIGIATYAQDVDIRLYQKIPMRDGVNLSANIFMPTSRKESLPVILVYTPYLNDEAVERGMFFAKKDYVFISLDLRGRGNSEGVYAPFEKDGQDGYDAIEWIAKQSWSNGKVGMMGGSYRGMVQWLTLKEKPNALKSIVPTASVGPGIDFPKSNGIFYNYNLQWLTFTSGQGRNDKMFGNGEYWGAKAKRKFTNHLPFNQWDKIALGEVNPIFQKWISHPDFDSYWQDFYPTSTDYESFEIPILTITGYFDADQPGAMTYYKSHMRYGSKAGKENHYLLLGPWNHGGTRKPVTELGGFTFSADSKLDMLQAHLEWFDWTLKGKDKPEFLKDKVNYYVMNKNEWQDKSSYSSIPNDTLIYYLSSPSSEAKNMINSGSLKITKAGNEQPDSYIYDPLDTTSNASYSGADYYKAPIGMGEENQLVYIGDPFKEEKTVFGQFQFGAFIELDVKDTDIGVTLYELMANGEVNYLGNDQIRARYRNSLEKAELVVPGEVNFYKFDDFMVTGRTIDKGSRLILIIEAATGIYTQKNYNSGKDVSTESGKDAVTATVKLHHSNKYPTYLKLPVK